MEEMITNAFNDSVPRPRLNWKPISQMDTTERREYNRLRAADSRKRRKEKEDLAEEKKRLALDQERELQRQQNPPVSEEEQFAPVPQKWTDAFDSFLAQDDTLDKVAAELNDRVWLYSFDVETIRNLQRMVFGIQNKYVQTDTYLRVLGLMPDVTMVEVIRSLKVRPHFNREADAIDLHKSPTFMEIYRDSLWKLNTIGCDPKYTSLMGSRMWGEIKMEWQRVCQS